MTEGLIQTILVIVGGGVKPVNPPSPLNTACVIKLFDLNPCSINAAGELGIFSQFSHFSVAEKYYACVY